MARKRTRRRDDNSIANDWSLPPVDFVSPLSEVEDLRYYHPQKLDRPAGATVRSATRLVDVLDHRQQKKKSRARLARVLAGAERVRPMVMVTSRPGFAVPERVALCVRRKRRKEVLHALRKVGRGHKRAKWNEWSKVRC